ncbi:tetratricopeptide repeat protein [candidate division WOR-3 bacterium]|nr:tetratricopeptide repeat protein [candidate division WOR-3 bacterium]
MPVFLFTDIEGSTDKWQKFGEKMGAALARHDEILTSSIEKHKGKVIKHTGDGIFAVFEDTDTPLVCAVDIQLAVAREDWSKVGELRLRVALHSGEAQQRGTDYFGASVNYTARLLDVGWGGQILLSPKVKETCSVPDKAEIADLGIHLLKDLSEPQRIYGLVHPGLPLKVFPALRSLESHPHNLPVQSTPFVGREPEIEEISKLLETPSCRLLTLLGQGGVGKTRLALQCSAMRIEEYLHGVYFVPLAPVSSPQLIAQTIADSLNINFYSSDDPEVQLLSYLKDKRMLLVTDNFEHLTDGADLLSTILSEAPGVRVLATSRERLNLKGEWVFEVKGMRFPGVKDAGDAETYSALELFKQSAVRANPSFELDQESEKLAIEVCRLVGGLPLGIELAASWLRSLSLSEIVEEMTTNLDFLETPTRDMPARHRSLKGVFEYSWKLLTEDEQKVLARLSVFRGGFTSQAARKVAGASLTLLTALVDKSLIRKSGNGRFGMHEVIRQYSLAKLKTNPKEFSHSGEQHGIYYAELLTGLEVELSDKRKQTLEVLSNEIDNIRAAWDWALEEGREQEIAKALKSVYTLHSSRGWFKDGETLFSRSVEKLARAAGIKDKLKQKGSLTIGRLLLYQGWFNVCRGDYAKAKDLISASLEVFRRLGECSYESHALNRLGSVTLFGGDFEGARKMQEESLEAGKRAGSAIRQAHATMSLGNIARKSGDYKAAWDYYQETLELFDKGGSRLGRAVCLGNLGIVAYRTGRLEESKRLNEESIEICREFDDRRMVAEGLSDLAGVYRKLGDIDKARELFNESIEMNREMGVRSATAIALSSLATLEMEAGNLEEAVRMTAEVAIYGKELGRPLMTAGSYTKLGRIAVKKKDYEDARNKYREALRLVTDLKVVPDTLSLLTAIAELYARTGQVQKAIELIGFVLENPVTSPDLSDTALEIAESLKPKSDAKILEDARKQSKDKDFGGMVPEIMKDLSSK